MKPCKTLLRSTLTLALAVIMMTFTGCGTGDWTGTYVPPDDPAGNIYVHDDADVLFPDTEKRVYELNRMLERKYEGAQFIVVTIRHSDVQIEEEARRLADRYHPGRRDSNNGMLYVINTEDGTDRLEVGDGLRTLIPDHLAKELIRKAHDQSNSDDSLIWDTTVSHLVDNLQGGLESGDIGKYIAEDRVTAQEVFAIVIFIFFMVFIPVAKAVAILMKKRNESAK